MDTKQKPKSLFTPDDYTHQSVLVLLAAFTGLFLLASVIWVGLLLKDRVTATGTVIELKDDNGTFRPVIGFEDSNRTFRTFSSVAASAPPEYQIGEQVEIIYSGNDPDKAKINNLLNIWTFPLIACIALIFEIIGIKYYGRKLRLKNPDPMESSAERI